MDALVMDTVVGADELRQRIADWRRAGARIAFVPTMGNLHNGHFSLITLARRHADRVVASVFVNPTQFGPREDFAAYPRTLEQDRSGLIAHGCDLLFAPTVEEIYPFGSAASVRVEVPGLSDILDGAARPGHFIGVATVVTKLFNLVQPDVAVFGRKDYQQLLVIRRLTQDLRLPVEIIGAPTQREANGLAMSSRNQYLTADERARGGIIYATLCAMRDALHAHTPLETIEHDAHRMLESAGLIPDYSVLRRAEDLGAPGAQQRDGLIALIAARLGRARLIDNLATDP
jgi:pantoate--beta-alanine ligase